MGTYRPIASITLGSSASSVEFSSIPQNFRDLVLVANPATVAGNADVFIRINNDSGSNYSWLNARGSGTSAVSSADTNFSSLRISYFCQTSDVLGAQSYITQFFDANQINKYKTVLSRNNTLIAGQGTQMSAHSWANTDAITSLVFFGGTFAAGSTFALYGIEA